MICPAFRAAARSPSIHVSCSGVIPGLGWAPGAFLSVSTFFTLSGFLITALLLVGRLRQMQVNAVIGGVSSSYQPE